MEYIFRSIKLTKLNLLLLVLAGVFLRLLVLPLPGTHDLTQYESWGNKTLNSGLHKGYEGVYFPIQYQLFSLSAFFVKLTNINSAAIYKLSNLVFDLGIFIVLFLILRELNHRYFFALIYWFHPWFFTVNYLGYADFGFSFFSVLGILLILKSGKSFDYFLAGIPISISFLMKPQAQIFILAIFIASLFDLIRNRKIRYFFILVPSVILFSAYSLYFAFYTNKIGYLKDFYLNISDIMPCLSAHMLNIWYPVAYFLKAEDAPIYSVSSKIMLFHLLKYETIGKVLTISATLIAAFFFIGKKNDPNNNFNLVKVIGFSGIFLPFLMTSAHENHLFFGSIFLLVFLAYNKNKMVNYLVHMIIIIQFINLFFLYGLEGKLGIYYPISFSLILSLLSIGAIFTLCFFEIKKFYSLR